MKKLAQLNPIVVTLVSLALCAGIVTTAFWLHPGYSLAQWPLWLILVFALNLCFRLAWMRTVMKNQRVQRGFLR